MFSSIYSSLSGLVNFSKGLDVISNNVANLNTPGFKLSNPNFQDLVYKFQTNGQETDNRTQSQIGNGVNLGSTTINFQQGDIRNTGDSLDVAVDGNGFFILQDDEQDFFSRLGQFEFDADDYLVDSATNIRVAGLSDTEQLTDINISDLRVDPALATTEITLVDNLSTGSATHTAANLEAFDTSGGAHTLSLDFTNNTGVTTGSWLFDVKDSTNAVLSSGEVRFGATGAPLAGFNTHTFLFAPISGASGTNLTLNFGEADSLSGATSFSAGATSTLQFDTQNGRTIGALTSTEFDQDGVLQINYSNGQTAIAGTLALAWFTDLQALEFSGNSLFSAIAGNEPIIGKANEGVNGSITANSIELSNVDLTEQFTDLIVVQRGFQGSSQIISASNELIQELLDLRSGR